MESKKLKYEISSVMEIDETDSVFAPGRILIGYCGDNRNWSSISEETFINAPIKNIPVVANFISDKNDFGGHDIKVIQDENGVDIYSATVPFGLVPESANQWFTEELVDGEMRKCYWTECLLWKRQYGFNKIAESKVINHSMEIDASEYTMRSDGYCEINKMRFEALCLLGDDVEPCFENSRLEVFSKDNFERQFTEMLEQYKAYSLKLDMEVNEMENENIKNVDEITEETVENEVADETSEVVETFEETVDESETDDVTESAEETTDESVEESEQSEETENDVESGDISEEPTEEFSEEPTEDYSIMYSTLKEEYDALVSEVESLREYKNSVESAKRLEAENEVFAKFAVLESFDEYTSLKENASNYSIEEIEDKCFAIVGRHGINMFESAEDAEAPVSTKFSFVPEEKNVSKYGDLFERYANI